MADAGAPKRIGSQGVSKSWAKGQDAAHQAFEAYLKEAKPGKTIATLAEAEWCDKQLYEEFAGFLFSTPIPKGRKNAGEPYSAGSITNYG